MGYGAEYVGTCPAMSDLVCRKQGGNQDASNLCSYGARWNPETDRNRANPVNVGGYEMLNDFEAAQWGRMDAAIDWDVWMDTLARDEGESTHDAASRYCADRMVKLYESLCENFTHGVVETYMRSYMKEFTTLAETRYVDRLLADIEVN